jgi:hypothetical protein
VEVLNDLKIDVKESIAKRQATNPPNTEPGHIRNSLS